MRLIVSGLNGRFVAQNPDNNLVSGDNAVCWPMYFQGHSGDDDDVQGALSFESKIKTQHKCCRRLYNREYLGFHDIRLIICMGNTFSQHIHLHQHIGIHLISKVPPPNV